MAYMSQEKKAALAPGVKAVLKKFGLKGSLSVHNHSTLVLNVKSGKLDFINNFNNTNKASAKTYISVNPYWAHEHFTGKPRECILALKSAMMEGNHDRSDAMTDYFDVGWYIDINLGKWDKPYVLE